MTRGDGERFHLIKRIISRRKTGLRFLEAGLQLVIGTVGEEEGIWTLFGETPADTVTVPLYAFSLGN